METQDNETREPTRRMHVQLDLPLAFLNRMNWIEMFAYVAHRSALPTITCPIICLALYTYIYIYIYISLYIYIYIYIYIYKDPPRDVASHEQLLVCNSLQISCIVHVCQA
jgi:hypothetical protein